MFKSRLFEKALDRATSELLLEADLEAMLQTCDEIRQKEITPKAALSTLKRKLRDENPHVISYSLSVLECWMKNCGPTMHLEVANRDFMDFLKDLAKDLQDKPKQKLLELIQTWSYAFKDKHRIITETYNALKSDGYEFPEYVEADTLFDSEQAPEWKDSNNCYHCRVEFGLITRKHHCRNCGEIFCGDCTKKQCVIPRFGYEREVRVCDACFDELTKKSAGAPPGGPSKQSSSSGSSRSGSTGAAPDAAALAERQRRERELQLQEEEELQLVMAISQSEYESQTASKTKSRASNAAATTKSIAPQNNNAATTASPPQAPAAGGDVSSELDRYLDRAYWERRQQQQVVVSAPSAPSPTDSIAATLNHVGAPPTGTPGKATATSSTAPAVKTEEAEQFVRVLQAQVAAFISRLKFDQQRGREVTSDGAVQTQFVQLSRAHEVLLGFMRETDDRRNYYESLQEKLMQLTDAREALDALRGEQVERRRRQAEEEERQRRLQMASKLDYMRARKHEYLEMQRRQALARLEEQQRDMALRMEQQKAMRLTQNSQMTYYQMMGPAPGIGPAPPGYYQQPQVMPGQQGFQNAAGYGAQPQLPGPPTWNTQLPLQQQQQQQQPTHPNPSEQNQHQPQTQGPQQQQPWGSNQALPNNATTSQQQFGSGPLQYVPGGALPTGMQGHAQIVPNAGMPQGMMMPPVAGPQQQQPMAQTMYYPQQQQFPQMPMASPQIPQMQQHAVVPTQPTPTVSAVAELIQFD